MSSTSEVATKAAALNLSGAGYPITLCNGKKPIGKKWNEIVYTDERILAEFDRNPTLNVGLILGPQSGIIDVECDSPESKDDLLELFDGELPCTPCFTSRRGDHHLFRHNDRLEQLGKAVIKFKSVEIRLGAGDKAAHSLVPPSSTEGHARTWIVSLEEYEPAELPAAVVEKLLATASKPPKLLVETIDCNTIADGYLDSCTEIIRPLPGDDFNHRGTWEEILLPKGWRIESTLDGVTHWRRPGKVEGSSATTGYCSTDYGKELFFCFSTDAHPVEPDHPYDKFGLYAVLHHQSNFAEAADRLRSMGYGAPETASPQRPGRTSKSSQLLEIASSAECFLADDGDVYGSISIDQHRETWNLDSEHISSWLEWTHYSRFGTLAGTTNVKDVIGLLKAKARMSKFTQSIFVRIGHEGERVFLDLCDKDWRAIAVTADGWRVVEQSPVHFKRAPGMSPLPTPEHGGDIELLRNFLNIADEDFPLIVGALLGALNPRGPYPELILGGEQGSAKSTTARVIRSLIDPNVSPLRAAPHDCRDLMIAADNSWWLCFDNLSKISPSLSDALCRLATGGGFSTRSLYTNKGEVIFEGKRPVILTGIEPPTERPDLLDRAILVTLPVIDSQKRLPEAELWKQFEAARPAILGALLDGVSSALRRQSHVQLKDMPRMADFATWVTAAESGLGWIEGTFMTAYENNRINANHGVLEEPLAHAVQLFMGSHDEWTGTATQLLTELKAFADDVQHDERWPRTASQLSGALTRLAPCLRNAGLNCERGRAATARKIELKWLPAGVIDHAQFA
ncbi:bifunctional DNA primase/polymerase [Aeoliella sp. SH292]|uniref:bifunctional DNA primase/polymerase n=1 Tax=Aeoliella sp. SH292 TaxID=3454464 RepID=UPI003F9E2677